MRVLPSQIQRGTRPNHRTEDITVLRTHEAGTLRAGHTSQTVTLTGWVARRRDHGGVAFLDLRDASGVAQVVVRDEILALSGAHDLRNEYCVKVTGQVHQRPEGNANTDLPTGEIEVVATELEVLSPAAPLPFQIDERVTVGEEARLKFRYLDLRRPGPAAAIRLRSKVNQAARAVLAERDFVEIETPTLTRSTPEGARDFLVPARLRPGSWYALPQSPQLFKQLLMVAGMERYYQIARCYRDEDFRADRQPEFTQLDIEMSFIDQDDIIELGEAIMTSVWKLIGHEITTPMVRMSYSDAMARYGSDKPDLRFGQELTDCTEFFAETSFRVFQAPYVGAVVMPGGAAQPRKQLDAWQEFAKQRGAKGLAYVLVGQDGVLAGPVAKNLTETEREGLAKHVDASNGDAIFFAAGPIKASRALLGAARSEIGMRCALIDESAWSFLWVLDAPLFEPTSEAVASGDVAVGAGAWTAVHHAFTSPKPEFMDTFDTDPGSALAYAYDLVCNGNEIGGGSIRIHRKDVQERVFAVMGLGEPESREKFGFLLDAFAFGAPPHGGIAFGWDRICSLLSGTDSIRDVIAFPKSGGGFDPLTSAPAPITATQRKEAGVDSVPQTQEAVEV
jgi:aspartyl-tRNA synthetase